MKNVFGKIAIAAGLLGTMGAAHTVTGNNAGTETASTIRERGANEKIPETPKQKLGDIPFATNRIYERMGGFGFNPYATSYSGVSPKEWGQYLQRTGKQKWSKRKNKLWQL